MNILAEAETEKYVVPHPNISDSGLDDGDLAGDQPGRGGGDLQEG